MTYQAWLKQAVALLAASDSPKRDAEILLSFVTQKSRTFIIAFAETALTSSEQQQLEVLLARRQQGEPIAYLVGEKEFWSLPLKVSTATLIPRPDTERLVELALSHLPPSPATILDLGTGTGAIALAIASERAESNVIGIDFQPEAVALAKENAARLLIQNVDFLSGSWFSPLSVKTQTVQTESLQSGQLQLFDMIVSNPPYIDEADPHLQQGDVRFEPKTALVASQEGLADIEHIIDNSRHYLKSQGWLLIEHGWQQGEPVRTLFQQYGFQNVITEKDYGGNDRVTLGCLKLQVTD